MDNTNPLILIGIAAMGIALAFLGSQISGLQDQVGDLEERVNQLENEPSDGDIPTELQNRLESLEGKVNNLEASMDDIPSIPNILEQVQGALDQAVQTLRTDFEELERRFQDLEDTMADSSDELRERINRLETWIKDLEARMSALEEQSKRFCSDGLAWTTVADEPASYFGQVEVVRGPVVGTNHASDSEGSPTFLNIGKTYKQKQDADVTGFTVVIWGQHRNAFIDKHGTPPEEYYQHKRVCVEGEIKQYQGEPRIEPTSPSQIRTPGDSSSDTGLTEAEVLAVEDGDTITVSLSGGEESVRLTGADATEQQYGMCYADDAETFLENQIANGTVWLDRQDRDRYGRLIADLYLNPGGETDMSRQLVRNGYGVALSERYVEAEQAAREDNRGLWSDCFVQSPKLVIEEVSFASDQEVVTLTNRSDQQVQVDDWTLYSSPWGGQYQQCPLPDHTLASGEAIRVHSGPGALDDPPEDIECVGTEIWHNGGDAAWLVNESGMFVDRRAYRGGYRHY